MTKTTNGLTVASVRKQLRSVGVGFKTKPETGEYLVTVLMAGGEGQSTYFADDLSDALATGLHLAKGMEALCKRAYELHAKDGEGPSTIAIYLGVTFPWANRLIDAGRAMASKGGAK